MKNIKKSVLALFVIEFAYVFYYSLSKFDFFIEFNDF
jgi:hypothetical protein